MSYQDTHTLFKRGEPGGGVAVNEWGLGVCKVCGAGEIQLYEQPCTQVMLGSRWRHNKRKSCYDVIALTNGIPHDTEDGTIGSVVIESGVISPVHFQRSTDDGSGVWAIYENDAGMIFARPVSEFTTDRFTRVT